MLTRILSAVAVLALPLAAMATEYRTIEHPRQECWNERAAVQRAGTGYGGAVIGGIAGGILGNQVGGGNGKVVATAIGAATGAMVGDRMSSGAPDYQTVQRCRTVIDREWIPVVRESVPIFVAPRPIIVRQPVQVVEQPVYYIEREERRYYREHWNRGWHGPGHHHHRHNNDNDDDDDGDD